MNKRRGIWKFPGFATEYAVIYTEMVRNITVSRDDEQSD